MSSQPIVCIRSWHPGDTKAIHDVLKDGSFSLISSTFFMCLRKSATQMIYCLLTFLCFIYKVSLYLFIILSLLYLIALYSLSVLSALVYLYGSTLNDIKDIAKSYFQKNDEHFWVATCNGTIAGTIAIVRKVKHLEGSPESNANGTGAARRAANYNSKFSKDNKKIAWLRRMSVKQEFRGLGIAKLLINEAVIFCRNNEYSKIFLITTEIHHAARALYSKYGFDLSSIRQYRYLHGIVTIKTYEYELNLSK